MATAVDCVTAWDERPRNEDNKPTDDERWPLFHAWPLCGGTETEMDEAYIGSPDDAEQSCNAAEEQARALSLIHTTVTFGVKRVRVGVDSEIVEGPLVSKWLAGEELASAAVGRAN